MKYSWNFQDTHGTSMHIIKSINTSYMNETQIRGLWPLKCVQCFCHCYQTGCSEAKQTLNPCHIPTLPNYKIFPHSLNRHGNPLTIAFLESCQKHVLKWPCEKHLDIFYDIVIELCFITRSTGCTLITRSIGYKFSYLCFSARLQRKTSSIYFDKIVGFISVLSKNSEDLGRWPSN